MPRIALAYEVGDISALARALRSGLAGRARPSRNLQPQDPVGLAPSTGKSPDHVALPSHVELLNLLARAAGFRNFQHFRTEAEARPAASSPALATAAEPAPPEAAPAADMARCTRAVRLFDTSGVLARWPTRRNQQILCLWMLWSRIPAGESFTEKAMNAVLNRWHGFGDHALLRRELVELGLMSRTRDGRDYRRIEQPPPPELSALRGMLPAREGG